MQRDIDLPLDDIISKNRKGFQGRKGNYQNRKPQNHYAAGREDQGSQNRGSGGFGRISGYKKILVTNLSYMVTDEDISELFSEFGVYKSMVNYDRTGRSRGSAEVSFTRPEDALMAVKKYNNALLDGRPMKLEPVILNRSDNQTNRLFRPRLPVTPSHNRRPNRYNNKQVNKSKTGRSPPKNKSVKDLDAELEAYREAADGLI